MILYFNYAKEINRSDVELTRSVIEIYYSSKKYPLNKTPGYSDLELRAFDSECLQKYVLKHLPCPYTDSLNLKNESSLTPLDS